MILAALDDLLFRSKIREVAKRAGVDVVFARTAAEVVSAADRRPSLAVIDLHASAIDPLKSLSTLSARGIPTIGFFAHVQTDLAEAALAAGATHVMPRSAFATRLPELLSQFGRAEATEGTEKS